MATSAVLVAVLLACQACGSGGNPSIHHQLKAAEKHIDKLEKELRESQDVDKAAEKQIDGLQKAVDKLEEQRSEEKRDPGREGFLRVPDSLAWVFIVVASGVAFLPAAVFLNRERWAVGVKDTPPASNYVRVSGAADELALQQQGARLWSVAVAGATGWGFAAAASSAGRPQAGEGEVTADARWPCLVLTILRLAGTERRRGAACWVVWTVVNGILVCCCVSFFLTWSASASGSWWTVSTRLVLYEFACDAVILAYHWAFAFILRGQCSPPSVDLGLDTKLSTVVCVLVACSGPLIIWQADKGGWILTTSCAVMNATLTTTSLACILLLECEVLPLKTSVDRMLASLDGTELDEVKVLQKSVKVLQSRWALCLGVHCALGGVALLLGSLSLIVKHQEGGLGINEVCMIDLNFSILFSTFLFLQIMCVARYNTRVHDLYMAVDDPEIALMLSRGELSFQIFGKTLDMPYFKTLAATSAASLAVGAIRARII